MSLSAAEYEPKLRQLTNDYTLREQLDARTAGLREQIVRSALTHLARAPDVS